MLQHMQLQQCFVHQGLFTSQALDENTVTTNKRKLTEQPTSISANNKRRRVHRVRFDERQNQEYSRHATPEDVHHAWMKQRDYVTIRRRIIQVLIKFEQVNGDLSMLCPDNDCLIGLEPFICKYVYRMDNRQRAFVRDICSYYRLQSQLGLQNDADALQRLACALSMKDKHRAIQVAQVSIDA